MGKEHTPLAHSRIQRSKQGERLRQQQASLASLVDANNKKEFFSQILPLLRPLKSYITRRLRVAYITSRLRTPLYTSADFLDEVLLQAYEHFDDKPANLSLEEWLYRLANERLERYFGKRKSAEKSRQSLEALTQAELQSLEEMPITSDADGEVWFPEELDDSEYDKGDFYPPSYVDDPEENLERQEEVLQIARALAHVPELDRIVFELFVVEGFPKEAVARIVSVSPEEVPRIVENVRAQVLREIKGQGTAAVGKQNRRAS